MDQTYSFVHVGQGVNRPSHISSPGYVFKCHGEADELTAHTALSEGGLPTAREGQWSFTMDFQSGPNKCFPKKLTWVLSSSKIGPVMIIQA